MERCGICGAPLLRAGTTADGWALRCLRGCGALPLEALEDEPARKAAEQAAAGLGWYALADADDAAMDRAEACFHKAEQTAPGDVALLWAQLMCRFGLRWEVDGRDAALLLRRMRLTQRRLSEDSDFIRLQDAVAGTDALAWFETEARRVDQLLARAQAMQAEEGFDVFLALKCEENGVATAEKRFSDALYDQMVGVYSIRRVFYAPKTLSGRTVEEFEPMIHRALQTAALMVVISGPEDHAGAPWVRSEWMRYPGRRNGQLLVCCLDCMRQDALPGDLTSQPCVTASQEDAGSVAGLIYKRLATPVSSLETPEAMFDRGRELLKSYPERGVELLLEAAKGQHGGARLLLGRCFERGIGVKADLNKARRCYLAEAGRGVPEARAALDALKVRMDADRGDPQACATLGKMYLRGENGLEPQPDEAARWLCRAAEAHNTEAMCLYGCMLCEGYGVDEDRGRGRRLLSLAKANGSRDAEAYLRTGRIPWQS